MASHIRRAEWLFAGLAGAIVLGVLWSIVDAPVDTGVRVHGRILHCSGKTVRSTTPRHCAVGLDRGNTVLVELPYGQVDQGITLAVTARRVTRRVFHLPAHYDLPQ